eukprot:gene2716-2755_t
MSHANVYRHFASKAALQDAVAQRWLHALMAPLEACVASAGPAEQRLREWVWLLTRAKRRKVLDDPELFATYHALAEQSREVVAAHVGELASQIARIIGDGVASGVFRVRDVGVATRAVQTATMRYHHPHFVAETVDDDAGLEATLELVIAGLKAGVADSVRAMTEAGWNIITDEGFVGLVGPFWQGREGEQLVFCFPTDKRHHNLRGVLQGGALMTFADRMLGMTVRMLTQAPRTATMNLDVQFIDAVQIGETVEARPRLLRATRNSAFLSSTLTVGERVVGNANGMWKLLHPRDPKAA